MVDLTPTNPGIVTSKAPQSSVSPAQVAQPYNELAGALEKSGEALETVATEQAKEAGLKAVTRDADGNIQVEKQPIVGPASQAFARSMKFAALAEGEGAAKRSEIALRTQYRDDPQGYLAASDAFRKETVDQYTKVAGPEVGLTLGKALDATTTQTYKGLLNEHERLQLQRAEHTITAGINSARDDAIALARGGDTSSPAYIQAIDKVQTLTNEKVNNPRLAYPKAAADYDMEQFYGHLKANGFLYHVDEVYKDQGINEDGSAKGGPANALEYTKNILTDPSIKLTEAQRNAYHSRAVTEIRANESMRKQEVSEWMAQGAALATASALGIPVDPADVEAVAQGLRSNGAPGQASRLYASFARKPLNDDYGRQPIAVQTQQLNDLRGASSASTSAEARLIMNESGGRPGLVNRLGYAGLYQFGAPLLSDLGIYKPGAGENIDNKVWSKTGANEPGKWSGTFNVPGFPEVKTLKDFLANPQAQKAAFDMHVDKMNKDIDANGLDKFIGKVVGGVPITREGLQAMIHLGGVGGTVRTIQSGGAINPTDENNTSLLDYARLGGHAAPNPAGSLWLAANRATTLQKASRARWGEVTADYEKDGIRPADATINQIVDAARATNDHALLEGIGHWTDRVDLAQNFAGRPLPEQQAAITQMRTAGAEGALAPGQGAVLKDLERRNDAITKGLKENPVSTTIQNFPERFNTPAPLNLKDPQALVAGLAQRGKIAQFAAQNWQTGAVAALDTADLNQIKGALDTPDPAIKGAIFAAISTLPEDVRNATLAKIGETRPDFMVAAAAGGLMRSALDVAQSILRGQDALKADKEYWPTKTDATAAGEKLNDKLPAGAFSLAGRTTDNGPYEVARGMIKARYADLSAQSSDTTGKLNETRLQQSVDDVTGGILHQNGGAFIAPRRGMSQSQFDYLMNGVTDKDLAGVTTLNGQQITSDYLRGSAQLESVGDGRYQVRLGKDSLRPIYAYQNANTETPQKFVLDLKNRPFNPKPPLTGTQAATAANLGGGAL